MENKIIDIKTGKAKELISIRNNSYNKKVTKKTLKEMDIVITSFIQFLHELEDKDFDSQIISIGLLHTVFDYVMQVAPNQELAYNAIISCLNSCKDEY